MIRLSFIILCLLLVGAVAGRYKAETAVRETRRAIERVEADKEAELREIQVLRAEVAYLESPERLAEVAASATDLEPLSGRQLMTASDFVAEFSVKPAEPAPRAATPAAAVDIADLGNVR